MQFLLLRHFSQQLIVVRFRRTTSERKSIILGAIIFPSLHNAIRPLVYLNFSHESYETFIQQRNYCIEHVTRTLGVQLVHNSIGYNSYIVYYNLHLSMPTQLRYVGT